jgi:hypothetical protein
LKKTVSSHISAEFDQNNIIGIYFGTVQFFILVFYGAKSYNLAYVKWHKYFPTPLHHYNIVYLNKFYKSGFFININNIASKVIFVPFDTEKTKAYVTNTTPVTSK